MRIVLDTNVLIAALISQGRCSDLLEHCAIHHQLVTSDFILTELQQKMVEKFGYSTEEAQAAEALLRPQMEIVEPAPLSSPACRDSDDDLVLGTAVAGAADCIVTGDKDLTVISSYEGIAIMTPRDFADFERPS